MKYLIDFLFCIRTFAWDLRSGLRRFSAVIALPSVLFALPVYAFPPAAPSSDTPVSGLINAQAVQFNPATGKVYTVDTNAGSVVITDDGAHTEKRVKVGSEPIAIAVNKSSGTVYVANGGDGSVTVIDGRTDAVTSTLNVGPHPYSIAANSVTGKVYVTHTFNDHLTIIDGATSSVTNIKMGSSDLIAIDEKTDRTYLLGYEGGSVKIVDGRSNQTSQKSVGMHAWGMAIDWATGNLYVAKPGYAQLAVLIPTADNATMVSTGSIPCGVAIDDATHLAYIVNYGDNTVSVVDLKKLAAIATIPVGTNPEAIAVDETKNRVYVANTHSASVSVIDGATNHVIATIPAGANPYALAFNTQSGKLHVANLSAISSTVIDPASRLEPKP